MKVNDFEKAIDNLSCSIHIDELVLLKGQVKNAYAHNKNELIKWDEVGRSYTCTSEEELPMNEELDPRNEVENWERNNIFDLKF